MGRELEADAPTAPSNTKNEEKKKKARMTSHPMLRKSQESAWSGEDSDLGDNKKMQLLVRFLLSDVFEFGIGCVILYSCVLLAVEVDDIATNKNFIDFGNHYVTTLFVFEWLMRGYAFGYREFSNFYGAVDTFIVWIPGVLVTWILEPIHKKGDGPVGKVGLLKTFRVMRMLRMLRIVGMFQNLDMFKDMWFLVRGMIECLPTLIGSMALIILYLYLFAIWSVDIVGRADFVNATADELTHQERFKSLDKAMLTLTRFMHGDDKQMIIDALHNQLPYVWLFFWFFIAGAAYVLCNLVTAVVVEKALEISRGDMEKQALEMQRIKEEERDELQEMFQDLDKDGSGSISKAEFRLAFEEPKVMTKLVTAGFSKDELMDLFDTLDDDDTSDVAGEGEEPAEEQLDLKEFEEGLGEIKGFARSKRMTTLLIGVKRLQKQMPLIARALDSRHRALQNAGGDFVEDLDRFKDRLASMRTFAARRLMQTKQEAQTLGNDLSELTDEAAHRLHQLRYLPPDGHLGSARQRTVPVTRSLPG